MPHFKRIFITSDVLKVLLGTFWLADAPGRIGAERFAEQRRAGFRVR